MKIGWVDKISNEEVLAEVNEMRTVLNSIQDRTSLDMTYYKAQPNYFVTLWKEE